MSKFKKGIALLTALNLAIGNGGLLAAAEPITAPDNNQLDMVQAEIVAPAAADKLMTFPEETLADLQSEETVDNNMLATGDTATEGDGYISAATNSEEYYQQTVEQYGDFPKDSQFITDADYFGVWDETSQTWTTESLLDYEKYPGLSTVCEATKRGNYDDAKTALLLYYQNKFASNQFPYSTLTRGNSFESAKLAFENIAGGTPNGVFAVTREDQECSVDITETMKSVPESSNKKKTFLLFALKKDGYTGVFQSKESGQQPYVKVMVNGRERTYYPIADATVAAGVHRDQNYGTEQQICVEESYSTVNGAQYRMDDYTKRGYLMFDFSDINDTDVVDSAAFYITGKMEQSDNPASPGLNNRMIKDIVLFNSNYTVWDDENVTWNAAGTDITAITSYDFEKSVGTSDPNDNLLWAYLGTGNEVFAYHYNRQFACRVENGMTDGDKHDLTTGELLFKYSSRINFATQTDYMTPELFCTIMKYYYMVAEFGVEQWKEIHESCNFGSANAMGIATAAMLFPEYRVVDEPLVPGYKHGGLGGWKVVARERMTFSASAYMNPDGSCHEIPLSYTAYALYLLQQAFDTARYLNIDMREFIGQDCIDRMERMYLYIVQMSNPRFGTWQQGHDSSGYTADMMRATSFLPYTSYDEIIWGHSNRVEGKAPSALSYAWDLGQKITLRNNWTSDCVSAFTNADGGAQVHGQMDDLSLNIYAYGDALLQEPTHKDYNYSEPVTAWLMSSKAVNAVEINNTTQRGPYSLNQVDRWGERLQGGGSPISGNIHPENRELNDLYNFVRAETYGYVDNNSLKDDFTQFRDILFIKEPGYFIVTDYAAPQNDQQTVNTYKQYWHSLPNANFTIDPENNNARTNFTDGPNIVVAPVEQKNPITANLQEGYYCQGGSTYTTQKYVRYDKQAAGPVVFNTVLYPMRAGQNVEVETEKIVTNANEYDVSALKFTSDDDRTGKTSETYYYSVLNEEKQQQRMFEDYETDGSLTLIQKNGSLNEYGILRDGTNLKQNGEYIIKSNSTISDLGVSWQGKELALETTKGVCTAAELEEKRTQNLATAGKGEASDGIGAEFLTDGDYSTSWKSGYFDAETTPLDNASATVTFDSKVEAAKIRVVDADAPLNYYVYYIADNEYETYLGTTNKTKLEDGNYENVLEFPAVESKTYKIVAAKEAAPEVFEIELFGANSETVVLDELTIKANDNQINKVTLNGEEINFNQKGRYIYFGDEPLIDDSVEPTPTPTPGSGIGGGSSHGASGGGNTSSVMNPKPTVTPGPTPTASVTPQPSNAFQDELSGHWAEQEISALIDAGVVKGDGESLNLAQQITRAEFITMVNRAVGVQPTQYQGGKTDVSASDWFAGDIAAALQNGFIDDSTDSVRPMDFITREEMAKIVVSVVEKLTGESAQAGSVTFQDAVQISKWAQEYIAKAVSQNLMNGFPDGTFRPVDNTLREQAMLVIYRLSILLK